eukprot:3245945-Amphidinium_carterae.1
MDRGYINMLSVPKQQSHKRELPAIFEGNKQTEQQGPTTTFKNWAAEVQIYMSLEDHNLATILEDIKTEMVAITDSNNVDFRLHEQGLGSKDVEELRDRELQRTLRLYRVYTMRTEPIIQRNAERRQRRHAGIDRVDADEAVPETPTAPDTSFTDEQQASIDEYTEAFHHYSRALQYTLTKITKVEPYRFVAQCNHDNSSGFKTWRRLHMTYNQGEKAQQLGTLAGIMRPTWNNQQQKNNNRANSSRTSRTGATRSSTTKTQTWRQRTLRTQLQRLRTTTGMSTSTTTTQEEYKPSKKSLGKEKEKTKTRKERATTTTINKKEKDQNIHNHNNHNNLISLGKEKAKEAHTDNDLTTQRAKSTQRRILQLQKRNKKQTPLPPYGKGKGSKGKGGKRNDIVCYYCGKPGHTSDKCWWKGQIYNIDQSQPVWSVPNDNQPQQLQQLPQHSSVSTTIMTQPQQTRLENMSLYEQGSLHTGVNSITGTTLIVNKDNTTTDQLRRWAVLIDTGAILHSHTNQTITTTRSTNTHSSKRRRHPHLWHQRSTSST